MTLARYVKRIPAPLRRGVRRLLAWRETRAGQSARTELEAAIRRHGKPVETLARASDPGVYSVLIPARGAAGTIGECLDSIVTADLPSGMELEVLVGIDACQDTRRAVVAYLAQVPAETARRVKMLFFPHRLRAYVVKNSLLRASRGAVVQLVDADDALVPGVLGEIVRFAAECGACTPEFIIRLTGRRCDADLKPLSGRTLFQLKGALILSKAALGRLGGFAPWVCAADTDFLRRAEQAAVMMFCAPKVQYLNRRHPGQLTRQGATGMDSELRRYYWRLMERRLAQGRVQEVPVVGEPAP